jgi:hypothetical protein
VKVQVFWNGLPRQQELRRGSEVLGIADENLLIHSFPPVVVLRDTTTGIGQRQFLSQAGKLSSYRVKFKGQWDRVAGLRR